MSRELIMENGARAFNSRLSDVESKCNEFGFRLHGVENYIHEDFGDVLTLYDGDTEVYVGTLLGLDRWIQGFRFARESQGVYKKREWVGLTDDEVFKILDDVIGFNTCFGLETNFVRAFARAIEAKLKEKNT